jgi:hypothetical protein
MVKGNEFETGTLFQITTHSFKQHNKNILLEICTLM